MDPCNTADCAFGLDIWECFTWNTLMLKQVRRQIGDITDRRNEEARACPGFLSPVAAYSALSGNA